MSQNFNFYFIKNTINYISNYLFESNIKMITRFLPILIFTAVFVLLLPSTGFATIASTDTVIGDVMCNVSNWMHGSTGKGLATLGIVMLGILALFNKISWNLAIIHAVGGVLIVGASSLVTAMNAGGTGCI